MKISDAEMKEIYEKIKTPYKYGAVIKDENYLVDCPSVFRYKEKWYMYFIMIHKNVETSGYETHCASSDDLLSWKYEGKVFKRAEGGKWDSKQVAGYAAFVDNKFGGSNEMKPIDGKYYMSYMGGNSDGYEPDPLSMGMAFSDTPIGEFIRFDNPIMTPFDKDAREPEKRTLYRSDMFVDEAMVTGHKYVNAYNAKANNSTERIFLAVSDDGVNWKRFLDKPVVDEVNTDENIRISADPQIVKIDDIYVMFYFRYAKGAGAYNTFACSRNLVDWTTWKGEPLVKPEYEWENVYAHKCCVIKHNDTVYHYYCAVNEKDERFIALATSKEDLK